MTIKDLEFEKIQNYDPYNDRAKSNGMVTEWVARNGWGNAVAFGYTKAECVADAPRYCNITKEENKMRVSSLVFIQQLLEAEVEKEKKAVEKVKTLLAEKEDADGVQWNTPDDKVNDNIRFLRSARATHRENLSKVEAVLEDFMGKDWD